MTARWAARSCHDPLWLRTCYSPELEAAYVSLAGPVVGAAERLVDRGGALNDVDLYGFDKDWSLVLLRIPELCDVVRFGSEDMYEEREHEIDEAEDVKEKLAMTVVTRLYLIDRDALEEGLVTILWLNCHGECVWHNRVRAEGILEFTGAWQATPSLDEMLETFAENMEKGARLQF
jgi:hypothetical protein